MLGKLSIERETKTLKLLTKEGMFNSTLNDTLRDLEHYDLISTKPCMRADGVRGYHILITEKGREHVADLENN